MKDWLVFLGPSLEAKVARGYLAARYEPPIRRGDLERLWNEGARRFAIIDGEFGQSLAVSLTEIRSVLRRGGLVCGAGSMGALRAAEAAPLGMHGCGWIYENFSSGVLDADDEVALTFDADTGRALTLPLVNVRWALELLQTTGALTAAESAGLLELARNVPYHERSWGRLLQLCPIETSAALTTLRRHVERGADALDRKRLDAIELLLWLAEGGEPKPGPVEAPTSRHSLDITPESERWLGDELTTQKAAGSHRQLTRSRALELARLEARRVGVSRLSDLTRLDSVGVHVWSSVRPHAEEHDNTVTGGKGFTREAALIGACVEAIERSCMSVVGREPWRATFSEASARGGIDPRELVLDCDAVWDSQQTLAWWPTRDVLSGELVHVPASSIFFPFREPPHLHSQCSTGLAAGASLPEALLYGLLEIIERHAATRFGFVRRAARVVDLASTSSVLTGALEGLRRCGVEPHVWLLESEVDVPTFRVVLDDTERRDSRYFSEGYAAHLDPQEALQQALLEALFARSSLIAGAREDLAGPSQELAAFDYTRARKEVLYVRDAALVTDASALPDRSTPTIRGDLRVLCRSLRAAGIGRVLATNLSHADSAFVVVRCLVPGLAFAPTGKRLSRRVLNAIRVFGAADASRIA